MNSYLNREALLRCHDPESRALWVLWYRSSDGRGGYTPFLTIYGSYLDAVEAALLHPNCFRLSPLPFLDISTPERSQAFKTLRDEHNLTTQEVERVTLELSLKQGSQKETLLALNDFLKGDSSEV